eukprot:343756-Pleurochrysis_carterae.AAC.1
MKIQLKCYPSTHCKALPRQKSEGEAGTALVGACLARLARSMRDGLVASAEYTSESNTREMGPD